MRDFRWMTAIAAHTCTMCRAGIKAGDGFYYLVGDRQHFCRECGRTIRAVGYDRAMVERGADRLFKDMFGDGGMMDKMFGR